MTVPDARRLALYLVRYGFYLWYIFRTHALRGLHRTQGRNCGRNHRNAVPVMRRSESPEEALIVSEWHRGVHIM